MWRKQFRGEKSFGHFQCWQCKNAWISAHAFKGFKQACKACGSRHYSLPKFMWVNRDRKEYVKKEPRHPERQHEHSLCEACKAGRCLLSKS